MKARPINARMRTEKGTRACRRMRSAGEVPANLYGVTTVGEEKQHHSLGLAVSAYDMTQVVEHHAQILEVSFEGRTELVQVIEVQRDAFGDDILHVDLHMIDKNKPITAEVDLVFKGEAKGAKEGGQVRVELRTLEVEALPRKMPREIVVRIDELGLEQAILVKDLPLKEGVKALEDPEQVVVQVVQAVEVEEEAAEAAPGPAEPEVIRRPGKEEED